MDVPEVVWPAVGALTRAARAAWCCGSGSSALQRDSESMAEPSVVWRAVEVRAWVQQLFKSKQLHPSVLYKAHGSGG